MTGAEWDACADPGSMLLTLPVRGSGRKARLLAAACCRRLGTFLDPDTQAIRSGFLDVMERRADEPLPDNWADAVTEDAAAAQSYEKVDGCAEIETCYFMIRHAGLASGCLEIAAMYAKGRGAQGEAGEQAALVRDIFGNPSRPPPEVRTTLRTPLVLSIASTAYEDRLMPSGHLDPARLAVLADALEESGCTNTAILTHLRSAGPHVRGCWALDLVLGKE
jgi:hypothetical protein